MDGRATCTADFHAELYHAFAMSELWITHNANQGPDLLGLPGLDVRRTMLREVNQKEVKIFTKGGGERLRTSGR
jgi:hypothetical protein